MKTMKVEEGERFYFVNTGIEIYGLSMDVLIKRVGGEWVVIAPDCCAVSKELWYLLHGHARALGRALILAADWALAQNQKERGAE
jgi:hypothetical protein